MAGYLQGVESRGYEVVTNVRLAPHVHQLKVRAPVIAGVRQPGQFVILRRGPGAERIPITIVDSDPSAGTITLIILSVGKTTSDLVSLEPGQSIEDVAGPLGRPSELLSRGHAVCVGGGVGTAVIYPIAQALNRRGVHVTSVIGAKTARSVLLEGALRSIGRTLICTEDGTAGRHGLVTDALRVLIGRGLVGQGKPIDAMYAAGPVPMMRAVAELTRPFGIPTSVSLNPIMLDGTGMCGGCRVTVGGRMRFACVDGPEFDGHQVDFDELIDRLTTYQAFEQEAIERMSGGLRD